VFWGFGVATSIMIAGLYAVAVYVDRMMLQQALLLCFAAYTAWTFLNCGLGDGERGAETPRRRGTVEGVLYARAKRAPPADRPAPAADAALRLPTDVADFFFADSGLGRTLERRTMELGRSARTMERSAAPGERSELRGLRQRSPNSAALTLQASF
jgi:hypothetical protein